METNHKTTLSQLIRNQFNTYRQQDLMINGPSLINMARDMGLAQLATELENNLRLELPRNAYAKG